MKFNVNNVASINDSYVYTQEVSAKCNTCVEKFNTNNEPLEKENFADETFADEPLEKENFADENFADENFADENFADENFADENFADENFADENFADENFADENFADENFADEPLENEGFSSLANIDHGFLDNKAPKQLKKMKNKFKKYRKACICPKDNTDTYVILGLLVLLGYIIYSEKK